MSPKILAFFVLFAAVSALPTDPIIKLDPEIRYALVPDSTGKVHNVDLWVTIDDLKAVARYNPTTDNQYHLFTRLNPTTSQPLLVGNNAFLSATNFDPRKRTYIITHGWLDNAQAEIFSYIIPAILEKEDSNVIMVDWSAGGGTINYVAAVINAVPCGEHLSQLINWLIGTTDTTAAHISLIGHSLGAHISGIAGRRTNGDILYINGLDPALPGWLNHDHKFTASDAIYTEVIHTNGGVTGYLSPLADVDFYPNGGASMAGCGILDPGCSHNKAYEYFAESVRTGGFTGVRCASYLLATQGLCVSFGRLQMGGLNPKLGSSGVYYVATNDNPPYSQG